jgi:hypothetical protein
VAADLDLTRARSAVALEAMRWLGLALLLLAALVVLLLTGWAAVTLLGCVVAGAGLTYLTALPLGLEERLAYGTVVGAVAVTAADFLLASLLGFGLTAVLGGLLAALAASAPGWWMARGRLRPELDDAAARWQRREPWPLWALLALCWPFTLVVLARSYQLGPLGLSAGGPWSYADWAAHLTYAGSFAFGHNFPPQFPVDPGHRMAYPFMIDLLAASFVPLGTSLTSALVLSSGILALAFPAVMYLAGLRIVGTRGGAALAVLVFTLSGGLGFLQILDQVRRAGLTALQHLGTLATQNPAENYQWLNPVLAWMLPQRSVLFGYSVALMVLAMLWTALRHRREAGGRLEAWAPFAFAGALTGLVPLFHLHAYGTVLALAAFWALFSPRRQWVAFFAPALVLGAPAVLWMVGGGGASLHWQPWWMANTGGHADGPVWFWLKNTGVLVPVMAAGFLWRPVLPPGVALHLAPIWLWFLVPNFVVFQPWDWDNTKFFAYWALIGALPAGALLARLLKTGLDGRVLAYALAAALVLSGVVDLGRTLDPNRAMAPFTDPGGLQVAAWARANTAPTATFLVASAHNEPIPTLAGRRVVAGYPGWLWTYGLDDWKVKTDAVQLMLRGDPTTPDLLRRYGVDYVVIGPLELGAGADPRYFSRIARQVYAGGGYTVYRVG